MTKEEYDALIKKKQEVKDSFKQLSNDICVVLKGIGIVVDGKAEITSIEDGVAHINYIERRAHASCCGDNWESTQIPAIWIFGGNWKAEHAAKKAEEARIETQKELNEAAEEKLAQEKRDIEEFERLKEKFNAKPEENHG